MKAWWRRVRPNILPPLIVAVAKMIMATVRIRSENYEKYRDLDQGRIYCGWHGLTLPATKFFRHKGVWVIISLSRDGEMQTKIFSKFGFQVIRGSTGRGGERALVEAIRALKKGGEFAITPDGPRGPTEVVQPGVIMMAKKSGCLLVPIGIGIKPATRVGTWDHYAIPWMFGRVLKVFGEPITVPPDADDAMMEAKRLELENAIKAIQADADARV